MTSGVHVDLSAFDDGDLADGVERLDRIADACAVSGEPAAASWVREAQNLFLAEARARADASTAGAAPLPSPHRLTDRAAVVLWLALAPVADAAEAEGDYRSTRVLDALVLPLRGELHDRVALASADAVLA